MRDLTWRIRTVEVRRYRHFYRYFLKYQQQENPNRPRVLASLLHRAAEFRRSDVETGLHHAGIVRVRGRMPSASASDAIKQPFALIGAEYPVELVVRMALEPSRFNVRLQRWAERPVDSRGAARVVELMEYARELTRREIGIRALP